MPKVGGKNIESCMEICMTDPKTKEEYPDTDKRQDVCYAACNERFETNEELVARLVKKYKTKKNKI